jgi:predicted nucleotidyltransferase component of viral defense system
LSGITAYLGFYLGSLTLGGPVLIFKGGTALRRCHYEEYRFSEDLDFSLEKEIPQTEILTRLEEVFQWVKQECGIAFRNVRQEHPSQNTYTIYLGYKGPMKGPEKEVKVDITFKELFLFAPEEKMILKTYAEYSDFQKTSTVLVYSLKEIACEKVCTLFAKNRNEPRDLYDVYCLLTDKGMNLGEIYRQILEKMKFKGATFEEREDEFERKEPRLKASWEKRLGMQMAKLPEFEAVFREVRRAFRQAGLLAS